MAGRPGAPRALALLVLAASLSNAGPSAGHDIPDEVRIPVFLRQQGGDLHLIARVPLLLLLSLDVPKRGPGYLDLEYVGPVLRRAAEAFGREAPLFGPGGERLAPEIQGARVALPWDRSFTGFEAARDLVASPPLPADTQVFWNQGYLDVHLRYDAPPEGRISVECNVAPGFGDRVALDIVHEREDGAGGFTSHLVHLSVREGRVVLDPSRWQAGRAFFRSGVGHILSGWDHLLFLLCLIAPFGAIGRLRRLVLIVTGFTVAHSITLVAAALGKTPDAVWFPPLVESVVALSILYTAVENLVSPTIRLRAALAFVFGLFHGFGFAFALGESLAFAGAHVPFALFSFNLGVEAGQVLVILMALPLLHLLGGSDRGRLAVNAILSGFAGHAAWHLLAPRIEAVEVAWAIAGGARPDASWLLAPALLIGGGSWVVIALRRRSARAGKGPADGDRPTGSAPAAPC